MSSPGTRMRLDEICDILNGYAFKSKQYVEDGIRIIRIANVQKGYIEDASPCYYPYESEEAKRYALRENDMLMSLTGNVGRVGILGKEMLPAALNQRVACLRIKDERIIRKKYLFYMMNSSLFEQRCIDASNGVAQKNLSAKWLNAYEITVPKQCEQDYVTGLFDTIHILQSNCRRMLIALDNLVKSRFVEMFGDPVYDTKKLGVVPFETYTTGVRYGISQPPQFDENGEFAFIRATNISNGRIIDDGMLRITAEVASGIEKCKLEKNDMIIVRSGAYAGDTCAITERYGGNYAGYDVIVSLNEQTANAEFFNVLMNTNYMQSVIKPLTVRSAQPHINADQIRQLPMLQVPITEQHEFVEFVRQVDKSRFAIQELLGRIELLRSSMEHVCFEE